MKSLLAFANVKMAIESAIASSDVDNGTRGLTFEAACIDTHMTYQKERVQIQAEMAKALRDKKPKEFAKLEKELQELESPEVFTIWKLINPIQNLKGTKVIVSKGTRFILQMPIVDTVWIGSEFMKMGGIEGEDTKQKYVDSMGREFPIVKLQMKKGIIDVYRPIRFGEKELLPKRAVCTIMSLRAQQITGELIARERTEEIRRYGFDAETI